MYYRQTAWAELLSDIVSVSVAKGRKAGHLRYCSWSVYVLLKDTLFRKLCALNSGQLFNPGSPGWELTVVWRERQRQEKSAESK